MNLEKKYKVGILGATGMVGQRFITLLADHPWFDITVLAASARSAGLKYEDAVNNRWKLEIPMPDKVKDMIVFDVQDIDKVAEAVDFVFSAVDMSKDEIRAIEEAYAKCEIPVVSNNSAHRMTPDVPMVIPEINPEHFEIIEKQRQRLGTKYGFIAVKPNCSIQGYIPALKAWEEFKPSRVAVTTYQAISGAGKNFESWPEMVGNVIPFISGEETKSEVEPLKILGKIEGNEISLLEGLNISAQCVRVPVLNGHMAAAFIDFEEKPTREQLVEKLVNYKGIPQEGNLPSAPKTFIQFFEEDNRPQVTLDVDYEKGMGVSIGRLREDKLFDFKFVGLAHNTLRGAAGGAVLCAETLVYLGYIK